VMADSLVGEGLIGQNVWPGEFSKSRHFIEAGNQYEGTAHGFRNKRKGLSEVRKITAFAVR